MSDLALRPRSATELLDLAIRIVRQHIGAFFTIGLVGAVPGLLIALITYGVRGANPVVVTGGVRVYTAAASLVSVVATSFATAAAIVLGDRVLHGTTMEVGRALHAGARYAVRIIGITIVTWVLAIAGLILLVIPGVYVFLRIATATPICVLEGAGVIDSIKRAWRRGDGHVLHALGLFALAFLMILVPFVVIGALVGAVGAVLRSSAGGGVGALGPVVVGSQVLNTLLTALLVPFTATTALVLSYDLRVRNEGYDLERLADALEGVR